MTLRECPERYMSLRTEMDLLASVVNIRVLGGNMISGKRIKLCFTFLVLLFLVTTGCTKSNDVVVKSQDSTISPDEISKAQQVIEDYKGLLYNVPDYKVGFDGTEAGFLTFRLKYREQFKPYFSKGGFENISKYGDVFSYRLACSEAQHNLEFLNIKFLRNSGDEELLTIDFEVQFKEIYPGDRREVIVTEKGSVDLTKVDGTWKIDKDIVKNTRLEGDELPLPRTIILRDKVQAIEVKETEEKLAILKLVQEMFNNRGYYERFGQYLSAAPKGDMKGYNGVEFIYEKPVKVNNYQSLFTDSYRLFINIESNGSQLFKAPKQDGKYLNGSTYLPASIQMLNKIEDYMKNKSN